MQYQIRSRLQIHSINNKSIDILFAVEHFARYGYEYLYIIDNNVFTDAISYHDFIKHGLHKKPRSYVVEKKYIEQIGIDKYITAHNELSRIVVIDDNEFQYEINLMKEPELLHCIERELFALRFMNLFAQDVRKQLNQYSNSTITVFADEHVYEFLKSHFQELNFEFVKDLLEVKAGSIEYVLDYKYGKKLLSKIIGEYNKIDIYSIIEKIAIDRLVDYTENYGLLLKMYRIPNYNYISNLSEKEKKVIDNKLSFLDLINNEEYLEEFCLSDKDKKFVSMRGASESVRWDSGIDIIQGDCNTFGIEVSEGKRQIPGTLSFRGESCTVHFFGPCIVFGMLVVNDETIPAYFKNICIAKHKSVSVINHGGLNGNNVLNSIMGALITPMKKNDIIIIIDFFNDLPKEDYLDVHELYDVLNLNKEIKVRFFDHPVHCNSLANRLIAEYLFKQIFEDNELDLLNESEENWTYDKNIFALRSFSTTHSVAIKAREKLKDLINGRYELFKGVIGVVVLTDFSCKDKIDFLIKDAMTMCDILILYYTFDHLDFSKQFDSIAVVESFAVNERILVQQLSPYFNIYNYGTGRLYGNNFYDSYTIEKDLLEAVLIPNHVNVRFFYEKISDELADIYRNNGIDIKLICAK